MDPRLARLLHSFDHAHIQLTKVLVQPKDEFVRDAAIQRFGFTFELFWKTLQAYCRLQGVEANSPRASLREAFRLRLLDDDSHYMAMLQSRKLASHIYEEAMPEAIYTALPAFADAMRTTVTRLREDLVRDEEPGT